MKPGATSPRNSPDVSVLAWGARIRGPVLQIALLVVGLPLAVSVLFSRDPPLGVYLNGVVIGSLYALVAMGLILVYRANRIINFAQASMGSVGSVLALLLMVEHDVPWIVALVVAIAGAAVIGGLVEFVIIRRFANESRLILAVATIGVAQLLAFLEFQLPSWLTSGGFIGVINRRYRTPFSRFQWETGGVVFTGDHLFALVVVAAMAIGLGAFLRFTRIGIAIRGSAESRERAMLLGVPVKRISTVVWIIAAVLSGTGVFLRAPLVGLPLAGGLISPSILLYALAAAVIAGMERLRTALVAGLALGAFDQAVFYATRQGDLSIAIVLPIILVVLVMQRSQTSRAADSGVSTWQAVKQFHDVPRDLAATWEVRWMRWTTRLLVAGLFLAAPFLVGEFRRSLAALALVYAIIGVSLVVLTGWAGQISLGQLAFAAIGGAVAARLGSAHDWDMFVVLVLGALAGAVVAVVVGLPALRLHGPFLAVTTLALAATTQLLVLNPRYFAWLVPEAGSYTTRPRILQLWDVSSDLAFYYVCLAGLVLVLLIVRSASRTRSRRVLTATRDNTRAAQSYGINLARTKLAAFAMSGFIAAFAGGLYAYLIGTIDATQFSPTASIDMFVMAVIGGLGSPAGAVAGAVYVIGFRYLLPDYSLLGTGVGMLVLLLIYPGGLSELGYKLRDTFVEWVAHRRRRLMPSRNEVGYAPPGDLDDRPPELHPDLLVTVQ